MSLVSLPRIQVPLTADGRPISSEWYRFMHDVTQRIGGVNSVGADEVDASLQFDYGAALNAEADKRILAAELLGEVQRLSATIAELQKRIESLETTGAFT